MLGQSALVGARSGAVSNRVFVYEVEGLHQSDQTDLNRYPVRQSGTVQFKVPYARMNEELRRINRLGARIVSIKPLTVEEADADADA